MSNQNIFISFLKRQLWAEGLSEEEKVTRIQLGRIVGRDFASLSIVPIDEIGFEFWDKEKIESLSNTFFETACEDADGHNHISAYCLFALLGPDRKPGQQSGTLRIKPNSQSKDSPVVGETEPATPEGLQAQLMRHNEALMRTTLGTFEVSMVSMQKTIERQSNVIERLETKRYEVAEMREDALNQKHERELESKKLLADEERKEKIVSSLVPLLPAALNRIMAGKNKEQLVPAEHAPLYQSLKAVIEEIPQERLLEIIKIAGPQGPALLEILAQIERANESGESGDENEAAANS